MTVLQRLKLVKISTKKCTKSEKNSTKRKTARKVINEDTKKMPRNGFVSHAERFTGRDERTGRVQRINRRKEKHQ